MATTEKYLLGTSTVLLSTGLNSLANNALAISAAYDNTQGAGGGDGYTLCDVELVVTYGTAPANPSACSLWFLASVNGTNYEDGGTAVTPARAYDLNFPLRPVTTAQRITRRTWLPWGKMMVLLKNDGTGQSMAASGNTLTIRVATRQAV